jgi:CheY-like chemotaxis protein
LEGHEVRVAYSGVAALEMSKAYAPDAVFLDIGMPGMDGYEVARRLRREVWAKDLMLIALSGWGQDEHRRRAREAGFDRHVTKPADLAALQSVLSAHRESHRPGSRA